ncbi:pyruvate:ferredoxin (flavodoxin) oxidoreductase [Gallibacter intestinalis]|uniref:Pyruvate:ferredoxin oxidoreductase n=1 Tax=Gallibacter intestinalis TaxID=2779356 RepID=A0ABR9QX77_9FIRM|nr:pyruvate:ferredoxin (flavodoxin) oxidoreductase [Gallibacter intestinalis]MBE5035484.1 pyruvate:ferredoxin (flavodoxin) oxidoreductase [Gallibacter intestinalis]
MSKVIKIVDGNEAAAYVAYAFTEVAGIYPITPSSPMAEKTDEWSANGKKNIFGQQVRLVEMQSEAGAAGAVHGALESGALATTFTSSQGLMLMIPTLHRISGQRHPGVLHVAARTVGTHAFSIFGDHSDVMNCRQTGFAMLSTGSVQEIMDLAGVAHLSAIKGRIPFLHWFDGFRTSHEIQKVEALTYDEFEKLLDKEALRKWKDEAMNPETPTMRSTVQNPDIYFQVREANNADYEALPDIVESYMTEISKITGREYHIFNYYGAPDADKLIIAMGSVCGATQEVIDRLNGEGQKLGLLQVHLYRPFSVKHMLNAIPKTVKKIAVLDRVKEAGAVGEPLYEDVCSAYNEYDGERPMILSGRYGLSSKDTDPACIKAVYDNLDAAEPINHFTIGINDDVTHKSLALDKDFVIENEGTISCKFWGLGSDGTVGANKNSIKIIGDQTDKYCQAYFEYDTKKSFGITKSHLRFGDTPIRSTYLVKSANFIACHNQNYLRQYDIISELKPGGTFLLNCNWAPEELDEHIPAEVKRYIANNDIKFYIVDANKCSQEIGLGNRSNMVLQAAFFNLSQVIPVDDAVKHMKEAVKKTFGKKGEKIVNMNMEAVDAGINAPVKVDVPASWKDAKDEAKADAKDVPSIISDVLVPINAQKGDDLPVSTFVDMKDGVMPQGTSRYEKRGIATAVPVWDPTACIQCNQCSYVCPHAVIRPFLLDEKEVAAKPEGFVVTEAKGKGLENYKYSMQVSTLDCTSCGVCVATCPKGGEAIKMVPVEDVDLDQTNWEYAMSLEEKTEGIDKYSIKGSQFYQPLLEFSGACAGCGETAYAKLLTQLYGDKMYFANATGCTQAWGAAMPSMPYCKNKKGKGVAWSNSLFENNAEFSYGMCLAVIHQRENVKMDVEKLQGMVDAGSKEAAAIEKWFETYDDLDASAIASEELIAVLEEGDLSGEAADVAKTILEKRKHLNKKTMWMYGGDGWAYDIGYGGLDHVFAMGEDVNVLIVDTEVYSNTGGQSSKATPIGAVAQFQASGKKTQKKDLGRLMMTYDNIYVAQCAMGANPNQLLKAIKEAEEHKGPSIIICYAPCINHGIKKGMSNAQAEMKAAVESGYWNLYRWNPTTKVLTLDSKEPSKDLLEFMRGEVRYSALDITFPENAKTLFAEAEASAKERYEFYKNLAENK